MAGKEWTSVRTGVPILLYHDLESDDLPNEKTGPATSDTVVRAEDFENQLLFLRKHGFQTISLHEYLRGRQNREVLPTKPVIMTFDDGHHSNYHIAFKLLQRYGMQSTFFIVADRVGTPNHVDTAQIREMAAGGMEIGSHGLTHRYLPLLSKEEIEHELKGSKKEIEALINRQVEFFAYPGGHYDRLTLKLLAESAYSGACSCHFGLNTSGTDVFMMKRLEIRKRVDLRDFGRIMTNRSQRLYQMIDMGKAVLRSTVGLKRYVSLREKLYKYYLFKR